MKRALMAMAAALALLAPSAATALEPGPSAPRSDRARQVEIRVSGDEEALARVGVIARELLLRLDVQPNVKAIDEPATRESEPTPLVIAYVDLRNTTAPSIDIEDGKTHQELTRRNLSDVTSLETGVEALLHVLYLAVESSLQLGAQPPRVAPERKPAPPPAKRVKKLRSLFGFDVGPLLRLSSLGDSRVVPGGGALAEPRAELGRGQLGLMVSAALHSSSVLSVERGQATLRPLQIRVVPSFDWQISSDVSACVGAGAGIDSLLVEPVQPPERGLATPGQTAIDPVVTTLLGARVPISGRAFLSALASLDYDAAPTTFLVREGGVSRPLLQLPRLRAGFTLALSFTAAGSKRFSKTGTAQ